MKTIFVDAADTFTIDGDIHQELYKLLETYPNPKIILTNANDEQMPKFGLVDLPYPLFTLKHNPDKVDPVYFEQALEKYNLDKDSVIYFEHSPEAVESAKSIGINSYHYDSSLRDLDKLKDFLDNNL